MPGQVFGGEVDANLIQLRGEHVRTKSGTTKKRSMKEEGSGRGAHRVFAPAGGDGVCIHCKRSPFQD